MNLEQNRQVHQAVMQAMTTPTPEKCRASLDVLNEPNDAEKLAKAKALNQPTPTITPDWKRAIALFEADKQGLITLSGGFESEFIMSQRQCAKQYKDKITLSEKQSAALEKLWDKYPSAHTVTIDDQGGALKDTQAIEDEYLKRMKNFDENLPKFKELVMQKGVATEQANLYVGWLKEGVMPLEEAKATLSRPSDVVQHLNSVLKKANERLEIMVDSNDVDRLNAALEELTPETLAQYSNQQEATITHNNHELTLFYGEINAIDGKQSWGVKDKPLSAFKSIMDLRVRANQLKKAQAQSEQMQALSGFDPQALDRKGEDFVITGKDGKKARGYVDGNEWVVYSIGATAISSESEPAIKLAEWAKRQFEVQPAPMCTNKSNEGTQIFLQG